MPTPVYAIHQYDSVLFNGQPAGVSTWVSYTPNVRGFCSLAMVDERAAKDGAEVVVTWGEPEGGPNVLASSGTVRRKSVPR